MNEINSKIIRSELLPLSYYELSDFTGSFSGMRYKIAKNIAADSEEKNLICFAWFGKYAFDSTDKSEMQTHTCSFSEDGMSEIVDWLNELYLSHND